MQGIGIFVLFLFKKKQNKTRKEKKQNVELKECRKITLPNISNKYRTDETDFNKIWMTRNYYYHYYY